jgi:branched-chain amino acid aminotransferase
MMAIAFYNGDWIAENQLSITESNRSFRYGDGFFETIAYKDFKALWVPYHFERIKTSAKILQIALPDFFSFEYFEEIISLIVQKNDLSNARIRFHVFRDGAGTYLPETDKAAILCRAVPYSYSEPSKVIENVVIYRDNMKALTPISNIKSANALVYILAAKFAQTQNADDAIILNTSGNICETTSANLFLIQGQKIITPPLLEGCVNGIIRQVLIQHMKIAEEKITETDLRNADSIFLSNTIKGICPVQSISDIKYNTKAAEKIATEFEKLSRIVHKH